MFFRCANAVNIVIGINKFTGLTVGATSINLVPTDATPFATNHIEFDCSPAIDRCFGFYKGPGSDKRIEVIGHNGVSAYRHNASLNLDISWGTLSMGKDNECVFSDLDSKLFFITFDEGTFIVTIASAVTLSGVRNLKMIRDGSYTLVQQIDGVNRKVIKTTGSSF